MKNLIRFCFLAVLCISISCTDKKKTPNTNTKNKPISVLPFQSISANDLTDFKDTSENWSIVGSVFADRSKALAISSTSGSGILVNTYSEGQKGHLFTSFEHGDMELELDVLMPKGSNSGIYFQSRYEVQLFDSWGVENVQHSDMGGIYQRWNDSEEEGKEGFEGTAPKINASKSPGLWQHLKIIFHAPQFAATGEKTKNAWFEEVWLNGVLVQEYVELSGPTRASAFEDEKPVDALMFQGDHGPVAFKNIKYKLYSGDRVLLSGLTMKEYENKKTVVPNLDSLVSIRELAVDSISANMVSGEWPQKILKYEGTMTIPETGDYIFDLKLNEQGGILLIEKDTLVNMNGVYHLDSLGLQKINLNKGPVPFTFIYNKHRSWTQGFSLHVEGPGIQKHALSAAKSLDLSGNKPKENIVIQVDEDPVTQRGFLMHEGTKRTHCISVGNPQGIHYSYDLELGSLLQVWNGDFLDVTEMWHGRGEKQLGAPAGFIVSSHGDAEVAELVNEDSDWPSTNSNADYKQLGYEFDMNGYPILSYQLGGAIISNKFIPSADSRELKREVRFKGEKELWFKVADGEAIEELADGTFLVNNESYFIDFHTNENLVPKIRHTSNGDELVVKIPSGKQALEYSIIW